MRFLLLLFVLAVSVYAGKKFPSLCDICIGLIDSIQQALDHGEDVKTAVHKFCANDVPDVLVNACEKIVANSLDFIVDQLKEHKPEKEICESIHLC